MCFLLIFFQKYFTISWYFWEWKNNMKKIWILLLTLFGLAVNYNSFIENGAVVSFNQLSKKDMEYRAFYTRGDESSFSKYNSEKVFVAPDQKRVEIFIPSKKVIKFKLDVGENPGTLFISDLKINHKKLDLTKFDKNKDVDEMQVQGNQLMIRSTSNNPSIIYQEDLNMTKSRIIHWPVLIILLIVCFGVSSFLVKFMKSGCNKIDSMFVILFGILLFIPMGKISKFDVSVQENRRLARYPLFFEDNRMNEKFGPQFDTWFNDRFNGRDSFINIYNHIISYINLKPYSRISLLGQEGWMFSKGHAAVEMFQNNNLFSDKELQILGKNLVDFEKAAKRKGVKNVYFLLNNDKESLYGEFYPNSIKKLGKISRLEQMLVYIHEHHPELKVLNFKDKFAEIKKSETVFYKTGTHMNHIGSFYNYKFMMEEIKKDYPDLPILTLDDYTITTSDSIDQFGIDLDIYNGFKFLPSYPSENLKNKLLTLKHPHTDLVEKESQQHVSFSLWKNKNPKARHTALVLGDSFSEKDIDKYRESFSKLGHIFVGAGGSFDIFDTPKPFSEKLLTNVPEILIVESAERFFDRFLTLKFPKD